MLRITNKHFYEEHQAHYSVITDAIYENYINVPINDVEPKTYMEVSYDDCYLDEAGDLFVPKSYDWSEADEYKPVYDTKPLMTKLEIENLVDQAESPELNDPARNI